MFDEDDEGEVGIIYQLHAFAWQVKMGRLEGVRATLGYEIAAALKDEDLDEVTSIPYVDILSDAFRRGGLPRWE